MIIKNRPLGQYERLGWLLNQTRNAHLVTAAEISGAATRLQWRNAVNAVQKRHPMLGCGINGSHAYDPVFFHLPDVEIPIRFVKGSTVDRWQEEMSTELHNPLASNQVPLIRMVVIEQGKTSRFIISTHPSIADGIAHYYILRDVLTALGGEELGPLPLSPALEELLNIEPPPFEAGFPIYYEHPFVGNQAEKHRNNLEKPVVKTLQLSPGLTTNIRLKSRLAGTSLHGALNAAFIVAGRLLSDQLVVGPMRIGSRVSVRKMLNTQEGCGAYITTRRISIDANDPARFWELARRAKKTVKPEPPLPELQTELASIGSLYRSLDAEGAGNVYDHRQNEHFTLSNIGTIPFVSSFGPFTLDALWGPVTLAGVHGENSIGIVTINGSLRMTYASRESFTDLLETVERVLRVHSDIAEPRVRLTGLYAE